MTSRLWHPALLLIALHTFAPLNAQEARTTTQAEDSTAPKRLTYAGRITGTVVCADTRLPARGAQVIVQRLADTDGLTFPGADLNGIARVGLDGTYTVDHLSPGGYLVFAILFGYLSPLEDIYTIEMRNLPAAAHHVELKKYGTVAVVNAESVRHDIVLHRGASVSGRVLFSDGSPATQVDITVEDVNAGKPRETDFEDPREFTAMARTAYTHQLEDTDDRGYFRIPGLRAGTYRIAAVSATRMTDVFGRSTSPAAARIYSGDTVHGSAAKTYQLKAGDDLTGVDITIPVNAWHLVKGALTAVDGRMINMATVTLTDTSDDSVHVEAEVDDEGVYSFVAISPGSYKISSKKAYIVKRAVGANLDLPLLSVPTEATNTFADSTIEITVRDSDITDANLALHEAPFQAPPPPPPANVVIVK